jgi:hypothetical protein
MGLLSAVQCIGHDNPPKVSVAHPQNLNTRWPLLRVAVMPHAASRAPHG